MMEAMALFLAAFLAATLLPFSSEAALVAALYHGMSPETALLYASAGNILAIMVNYALGRLLYTATHEKLERSSWGAKALHYAHRKGYWALLLSPLPLIGDPITLAAGLARLHFGWFVLIAGGLRVARYGVIIALMA